MRSVPGHGGRLFKQTNGQDVAHPAGQATVGLLMVHLHVGEFDWRARKSDAFPLINCPYPLRLRSTL
jgi:hypothetical protein